MRKHFFSWLAIATIILLLAGGGCKSNPSSLPEENLRVSTDAASFITNPAPDFTFYLKVESVMPPGGVRIEYNVKGEIDNQVYPQGPVFNTSNTLIPLRIVDLPRQKICICTVIVTSKNRSTNTASTNFKIAYK